MKSGQVLISLTSHFPGEAPSVRQIPAEIRGVRQDDFYAVRLSYEQVLDEESGEKEPEVMTFRIGEDGSVRRVSVKRPKSAVLMEFEEGKTCLAAYPTPAGILDVTIRTRKVEGSLLEERLVANVLYEILLGEMSQGEIRLEIRSEIIRGNFLTAAVDY